MLRGKELLKNAIEILIKAQELSKELDFLLQVLSTHTTILKTATGLIENK